MNRKKFIGLLGLTPLIFPVSKLFSNNDNLNNYEKFYFKDDGLIPNNKLPLLLIKDALPKNVKNPSKWFLQTFESNNWTNSWTNGIYSFHHYHSTTHEVLGIYSGEATIHLGGEKGNKIKVTKGDVIIIPAGVGHKKIEGLNLGVVGAYPDGRDWDLMRGSKGERPTADKNILSLPIPNEDPLLGKRGGLLKIWFKPKD